MNQIIREYYPIFNMYQDLRRQLIALLEDADLDFTPGGANPTLGALCRELGEVETAYIESFKTFKMDFSYRHEEADALEKSVARLTAWYDELDASLKTAVAALSDETIQTTTIARGHDFNIPPKIQLTIYTEALLIFYGKVTVYFRMMGKELPSQWQQWIG